MNGNLNRSLELVFGHEGGYVNRKTDAGGPTKYGVTHRTLAAHRNVKSVTAAEVKALTLGEAAEIYRVGYWRMCGADRLPSGVDYAVFDFAVNSGVSRAVRYLQMVVGTSQDGVMGPQTLDAVHRYAGGPIGLVKAYCEARMRFLRGLKSPRTGFPVNGRGWTIRVTGKDPKGQWADQPGVIGHAVQMAREGAPTLSQARVGVSEPVAEPVGAEPATPGTLDAWLKPETVLQALPAAGGLSVFATGDGPVQIALGVALVVAAGVAAWVFVRRAKADA